MGTSAQAAPTTTTTPIQSPESKELMSLYMPGLREFSAMTPQRYQGQTLAPFSDAQTLGQTMALGAAGDQTSAAKTAADVFMKLPSQVASGVPGLQPFIGQTQNYETNPWAGLKEADPAMSSYIAAAQRPLYQNLQEQVLPNLRGGAITAGGFGGSRQGIAEGLAAGRTAAAAGDVGTNIAGQQYATNVNALGQLRGQNLQAENARYGINVGAEQERLRLMDAAKRGDTQALMQLLQLTPTVQQAQVQPALTTSGVGDVQRAMTQAQLAEPQAAFNFDQYAPYLKTLELMRAAQGLPSGGTQTVGSVPPPANLFSQALGGGITGASIGSAVPGVGTAGGAVAGATLPFLMRGFGVS